MNENYLSIDPDNLRRRLRRFDEAIAASAGIQEDVAHYLKFFGLYDLVSHAACRHMIGTIEGNNETMVAQVFQPAQPKGTVFLVHGYFDHIGLYRHVIELMLNLQLTVIAFDLPGHGLSSGPRASISDFDDYCEALRAVIELSAPLHKEPIISLGQSTGSAIIMTLALHSGDLPGMQKLILFAPLVRPWRWNRVKRLHTFLSFFGVAKISRKFVSNSHDPHFLEFLETKDPLQARYVPEPWVASLRRWESRFAQLPVANCCPLIVQGGNDETVDWNYNLRVIREHFARTIEIVIPEAKHHLANESPEIRLVWVNAIKRQMEKWFNDSACMITTREGHE